MNVNVSADIRLGQPMNSRMSISDKAKGAKTCGNRHIKVTIDCAGGGCLLHLHPTQSDLGTPLSSLLLNFFCRLYADKLLVGSRELWLIGKLASQTFLSKPPKIQMPHYHDGEWQFGRTLAGQPQHSSVRTPGGHIRTRLLWSPAEDSEILADAQGLRG